MFGKSYSALGVGEKIAVDQAVLNLVGANYQAITPELLKGQTAQAGVTGFAAGLEHLKKKRNHDGLGTRKLNWLAETYTRRRIEDLEIVGLVDRKEADDNVDPISGRSVFRCRLWLATYWLAAAKSDAGYS